MSFDDHALGVLIEESQDLHVDAMRTTHAALCDVVEHGHEIRAHGGFDPDEVQEFHAGRSRALTAAGAAAGVGVGAAMLTMMGASAAFADTAADVSSAQTAASLENLAVKVYTTAAGLPFMQTIANPAGATVKAFVTMTVQQHTAHGAAFNGAAQGLGGKAQTQPDMVVYNSVVVPALGTLKSPLDVVNFAAELELVAAETYSVQTAAVSDKKLRSTFSSIMGVENQHRATLLAVAALLKGNAPSSSP